MEMDGLPEWENPFVSSSEADRAVSDKRHIENGRQARDEWMDGLRR